MRSEIREKFINVILHINLSVEDLIDTCPSDQKEEMIAHLRSVKGSFDFFKNKTAKERLSLCEEFSKEFDIFYEPEIAALSAARFMKISMYDKTVDCEKAIQEIKKEI